MAMSTVRAAVSGHPSSRSWSLRYRNLQFCNMSRDDGHTHTHPHVRQARREQLLDVTKAIVAEHGFHAVSIEGVAREAGISRPIVYGHFDDLPGLLEALVQREGARALGQLADVLPPALAQGDAGRAARRRARRLPRGGARRPGDVAARADARTRARRAVLHEASRAGAGRSSRSSRRRWPAAGAAESPDPELAARLLSALADEAARLLLADPDATRPSACSGRWPRAPGSSGILPGGAHERPRLATC